MKTTIKKVPTKKVAAEKPTKAERIKGRIARMETRNKMATLKIQKREEKIKVLKTKLAELAKK